MAAGFIHIECFALSRPKGTTRRSVAEIIDEAVRAPDATPHVSDPKPPVIHFGNVDQIFSDLEQGSASRMVQGPRTMQRQRKDTAVLLAGVASFPAPPGDPAAQWWISDIKNWLMKEYGDTLKVVLEHVDESYAHVHFMAHKDGAPVKPLHPGYAADVRLRTEGATGKACSTAYKEAMRAFQDRYYAEVGAKHGMTRLGPARQRLTRAEWRSQQAAAKALAAATAAVQVGEAELQMKDAGRREWHAKVFYESQDNARRVKAWVDYQEKKFRARESALADREKAQQAREAKVSALLAALDQETVTRVVRRVAPAAVKPVKPLATVRRN